MEEFRPRQSLVPQHSPPLPVHSASFTLQLLTFLHWSVLSMNRETPNAVKSSAVSFPKQAGGISLEPSQLNEQEAYPIWKRPPADSTHKLIGVIFLPVLVQDALDRIKLERQQCL